MTKEEISCIKSAIETVGLTCSKFPKKLEIRIPKVKYPGVYFNIPTDSRSFKIQVYFHQTSYSFFEKINTRGYVVGGNDLHKLINVNETKGIPTESEMEDYLRQALEEVKNLGIVHVPELV